MDGKELHEKLSSIKPYTFYGDDPPRRLSKEPSKILQPLMEWAEKTHFKKGGLAGHKLQQYMPPAPKRPCKAYKLFFEDAKKKLLAKGGAFTRDEIQAVAPTVRQMWLDSSAETLSHYQSLAKSSTLNTAQTTGECLCVEDAERYESEVREYEHAYPECARQLKIKEHQKKARMRRTRELKKGQSSKATKDGVPRKRRSTSSASKKVSKWLDDLNDSDLTTTGTGSTKEQDVTMDCDSDCHTSSSEDMDDSEYGGYHGAYRFP